MLLKLLKFKLVNYLVAFMLIIASVFFGYELNLFLKSNLEPKSIKAVILSQENKPDLQQQSATEIKSLNSLKFSEPCNKYPIKYPRENTESNISTRLSEYFSLSIINEEPDYLVMNHLIPSINYFYVINAIAGSTSKYIQGDEKNNLQIIDDSLSSARESYGLTLKNADKITKTEYYQSSICRIQIDIQEYNETKSKRTAYVSRYQDFYKDKLDSVVSKLIVDENKLSESEYISEITDFFVKIKVSRGQLDGSTLQELKEQVKNNTEINYNEIKFMAKNDLRSFYDSPELTEQLKNNLDEQQRCLDSKVPNLDYKKKLYKQLEKMELESNKTDEYYRKRQWYIGLDQGNTASTGTENFCNNRFDNTKKIIYLEGLIKSNLITNSEVLKSTKDEIKGLKES
jgi:hypothetical protein